MNLEGCGLFQPLSEATRKAVEKLALEETHAKGEFLFHAGDPAVFFYVLEEGRVRLSIGEAGHISSIVSGCGEMLGWSSMAGQPVYTASAECLLPVRVLKFPAAELARALEAAPADGLQFYKRLAELIGKRLTASYGATLSVHGEREHRYWG